MTNPKLSEEHYLKTELYNLVKTDSSIFEFLQKGALDGIWYWDVEHPENEWLSPEFWRLFGQLPSDKKHLASEWQDIIDPQDKLTALDNFKKHCKDPGHSYDQVVRFRHKDGSTVWVRCRGLAIRDKSGRAIRMLGAHSDVTPMMRAKQEAERAKDESAFRELLLRDAQAVSQVGSWALDLRTQKLTWTAQSYRNFGVDPDSFTPSPESFLKLLHLDDRPKMQEWIRGCGAGEAPPRLEFRVLLSDGNVRILEGQGGQILDTQNRLLRLVGTNRDITESKRNELALYAAKDVAEKANQTKDLFLATLSHELRTPLTAILSWAQLLKSGRVDPSKVSTGLQTIEEAAQAQNHLISDLLDISRIGVGKIALDIQATELTDVVARAVGTVQSAADRKAIRIIEQLGSVPVFVLGDATRLKQIVWNLLSNSIKFTPSGGSIEVTLGTCDGPSGPQAQIRVRDYR